MGRRDGVEAVERRPRASSCMRGSPAAGGRTRARSCPALIRPASSQHRVGGESTPHHWPSMQTHRYCLFRMEGGSKGVLSPWLRPPRLGRALPAAAAASERASGERISSTITSRPSPPPLPDVCPRWTSSSSVLSTRSVPSRHHRAVVLGRPILLDGGLTPCSALPRTPTLSLALTVCHTSSKTSSRR